MELVEFSKDSRKHIVEGIVKCPEDEFATSDTVRLSLMSEAVHVLIGGEVRTEQEQIRFKGTMIQEILSFLEMELQLY